MENEVKRDGKRCMIGHGILTTALHLTPTICAHIQKSCNRDI
jgi:hypothetical protein